MSNNIFRIVLPALFAFVITGCSVKDMDLGKILEPKEKKFEYKRELISEDLTIRVNEIVDAMKKNDIELINKKYIHPTFGFYNLYKIKSINVFTFQNQIYNVKEKKREEVSHLISRVSKNKYIFKINKEDTQFKCSPLNDAYYGWTKHGLFLNDKTNINLSSMMKKINAFEKEKYKKEDFHKVKMIEKMGYKVVLTPEIIFYLNNIDNNWYITLIDRITTDCSYEKKTKKKVK